MKRLIAWFVDNRVAANLLAAIVVVVGTLTLLTIRQEEFPTIDLDIVQISVGYPGATPAEVEEALCIRVEEAIEGTPGIDRMSSVSVEGNCGVTVELVTGSDSHAVLSELETKVNSITTFPVEAERPVVSLAVLRHGVLNISVSGTDDERTLKILGQKLQDGILALDGISQADLDYVRPYEISIELSEDALRRYGIRFEQVATAIRNSSLDLPGGSLKTAGGEILLRSKAQAYHGADFARIVVLTRSDGTAVRLGQIAKVVDGFRDEDMRAYFDGHPAVVVRVFQVGNEDLLDIADAAKAYVKRARGELPPGITLTTWNDESKSLRARLATLWQNAAWGLVLVLAVLALILRFRVAFWVAAGIPVALLGAVLFFPVFAFSISTLSVMGFLLVLGIVVDDAIVIGERVYAYQQGGESAREAAIEGASEVAIPVIFGVLTTVAAFLPLVLVPGRMGQFFGVLGATVILCLLVSLLEAQLVLPSHLAHALAVTEGRPPGRWSRVQVRVAERFEGAVARYYEPALERVLEWRYLAVAVAVGVLILTVGLFASGRVSFQFFPGISGDRVYASVTLPQGTPLAASQAAVRQLEEAARDLEQAQARETHASLILHVLSSIGKQVARQGPPRPDAAGGGTHLVQVVLELSPAKEREITGKQVAERWRALTGPIPDAVDVSFDATSIAAGQAIALQLRSDEPSELIAAAAELREALLSYDGVFDVADSFRAGKREIQLRVLPEAKPLGITQNDLSRQVRDAFYGLEVQRIQRGHDDVRVMLRYPPSERHSLGDLENMRIRAQDGTEVPFAAVAQAEVGRGFATIRRSDGRRVVTVTADVDRDKVTPEEIMASLRQRALPQILSAHPGVVLSLEGEQRERSRALSGLIRGFGLALGVIYVLLAIPLRSYVQPLIIMSAIPFGIVGAILGHFIMGWDLVFFSLLGIVALSGVVVNDSLVLVDFINRKRALGMPLERAVRTAGMTRFRAIFLTSITTFMGLVPLMFNSSPATFFVVPIAISLAFGVLFATTITLFIVPSTYLILEDLGARIGRMPRPSEEARPSREAPPIRSLRTL